MRVLVTGASGFVGSHVARKLLLKGYDVRVLLRESSSKKNVEDLDVDIAYGDLRQIDSLKRALIGCKGLFHVAASYSFWSPYPEEVYKINIEGTLNIIEAAKVQGIERIVYTSSESTLRSFDGRYGYVLNDLDDVAGDYKKSKLLAEKEVVRLIGQGIPINIINPTTPIGSRDIKPTPTGKIVLDMLNGKMPAFVIQD